MVVETSTLNGDPSVLLTVATEVIVSFYLPSLGALLIRATRMSLSDLASDMCFLLTVYFLLITNNGGKLVMLGVTHCGTCFKYCGLCFFHTVDTEWKPLRTFPRTLQAQIICHQHQQVHWGLG